MALDRFSDEKDAFWDLDLLLPPHRSKTAPRPFSPPPFVEVSVSAAEIASEEKDTHLTALSDESQQTLISYQPKENRLLATVRVLKRQGGYHFYGQFCRDAEKYWEEEAAPCDYVPFFSYIPQYSQMNAAQRQYYFYWRASLRRGQYLQTEESYFYLYVYEIINLPEMIEPARGIHLLCDVWTAYRRSFPRIDKYMTEWVTDYCLVHCLPCPTEQLRPFIADILPLAKLKEFYLGSLGDYTEGGVDIALAFFSNYDWRQSRYAGGEQHALFEKHILRAMAPVLRHLHEKESRPLQEAARTLQERDAFCGSLCAHHIRARLQITYYAVQDASYLRTYITAALKYTENKIRALLLIKSRLTVNMPDPALAAMIDTYFAGVMDEICPRHKEIEPPAYEKWYDAPTVGVNVEHAREIERASWDTTMALIPEEEREEIENRNTYNKAAPIASPPEEEPLTEREKAYLRLVCREDVVGIRTLLQDSGILEEELASGINEKSLARLEDVVLEQTDAGYAVILDYREDVLAWIQ